MDDITIAEDFPMFASNCRINFNGECNYRHDETRNCEPSECPRIYGGERIKEFMDKFEQAKKECKSIREYQNPDETWAASCSYPSEEEVDGEKTNGCCSVHACPKIEECVNCGRIGDHSLAACTGGS